MYCNCCTKRKRKKVKNNNMRVFVWLQVSLELTTIYSPDITLIFLLLLFLIRTKCFNKYCKICHFKQSPTIRRYENHLTINKILKKRKEIISGINCIECNWKISSTLRGWISNNNLRSFIHSRIQSISFQAQPGYSHIILNKMKIFLGNFHHTKF